MVSILTYIFYTDSSPNPLVVERDVLHHLGLKSPPRAMYTGVYHIGSNRKVFPYLNKIAKERGEKLATVTLQIDTPFNYYDYAAITLGPTPTLEYMVEDSESLVTYRRRKGAGDHFNSIWANALLEHGVTQKEAFPKNATEHPQCIDSIQAAFPKLKTIVYHVKTPAGTIPMISVYNIDEKNIKIETLGEGVLTVNLPS